MASATHIETAGYYEPSFFHDSLGPYYIRGCLQGAVQKGFDPTDLLKAAEIDASVYSDPEASIDGEQLQRLILTVRNALNDEYLGFLDVQGKPEMSYMVGCAAVRSDTLGQAMIKMAKLISAIRNDIVAQVSVDHRSGEAAISYNASGHKEGVEPHVLSWLKFHWLYRFQCWLIGKRIKLTKIHFKTDKPEQPIDYDQVFDCPVFFSQTCSGLFFSGKYLNAPIIRNVVELRERDFSFGVSDWFAIPGSDQTFSSKVEQLLFDFYKEGVRTPNLDVLGDLLACSPRTLQRKLQKENVSFQELKVKVRRDIAQKLLSSTNLPVAQIAEKVGFSEPADFIRAFVSWTGRTPSDYRTQHK